MALRIQGARRARAASALVASALLASACTAPIESCGLWRTSEGRAVEVLLGSERPALLGGEARAFLRPVPLGDDLPRPLGLDATSCAEWAIDLSQDGRRARVRGAEGRALRYVDLDRGLLLAPDDVSGTEREALFPDSPPPPRQRLAGEPVRWFPTTRIPQP